MGAQYRDDDTICAISTAPGRGGIAVVRLSGPKTLEIGRQVAPFLPLEPESHRVYYGYLKDQKGENFDEALVTYFAAGRSFTGQSTLEFSYHGSPALGKILLNTLVHWGARIAKPGEFTSRAFLAGRIDLIQAESVLALIESQTETAARMALRQLGGELSDVLRSLEDQLTLILAHLEASIDFSTEDIELSDIPTLKNRLAKGLERVNQLCESYARGRRVRDGLRIAIVGEPNVGKSSLLNAMTNEERAIVTPIAGTTRDVIESSVQWEGLSLTLVDTAGLRETEDVVEKMGIERSLKEMQESDLILHVVDLSQKIPSLDLNKEQADKTIVIGNKKDLFSGPLNEEVSGLPFFAVSATTKDGMGELVSYLRTKAAELCESSSATVMQARQFDLLKQVQSYLTKGLELLEAEASPEFATAEVQEALMALYEILGKRFDDQVMDRVFSEFCLGK